MVCNLKGIDNIKTENSGENWITIREYSYFTHNKPNQKIYLKEGDLNEILFKQILIDMYI